MGESSGPLDAGTKLGIFVVAVAFCGLLVFAGVMALVYAVEQALHAITAWVSATLAVIWPALHLALLVVALVVLVGLVGAVLWRRSLPRRASKLLTTLFGMGRVRTKDKAARPRLRYMWKSGAMWRVAWKMPPGVTVAALRQIVTAFEEGLDCSVRWYFDRGLVWMEAGVAKLPKQVEFHDFYREAPPKGELVVGIGMSRIGKLWIDLSELPHLLCGGVAKYGKTGFLRQLLVGLMLRMSADQLRVVLLDFKRIEFNTFTDVPHNLVPIVTEMDDAQIALGRTVAELARRQDLFEVARVENIVGWNEKYPEQRLPYVLVVVDEFAELRPAEAPSKEEQGARRVVLAHLSKLSRLGRAFGIHVIASTQRPDAETIGGQVKAQMPATVAFYCRDDTNSKILLDDAGAADLPPWPGRGIWQWDKQVQFQAPWLSKDDAAALLAAAYPAEAEPESARKFDPEVVDGVADPDAEAA